jgi:uncharacterized membrane protein YsdA (DUF1294 family)
MLATPDFVLFFIVYTLINGLVFFLYAHDKIKAKKNTWRTPENQLLILALIGPFGAFTAILVFRHKTRKLKFRLVPVFAILHIVMLIWILIYFMN